jgi:hypothetical protein
MTGEVYAEGRQSNLSKQLRPAAVFLFWVVAPCGVVCRSNGSKKHVSTLKIVAVCFSQNVGTYLEAHGASKTSRPTRTLMNTSEDNEMLSKSLDIREITKLDHK